jgi:hypothetical protein
MHWVTEHVSIQYLLWQKIAVMNTGDLSQRSCDRIGVSATADAPRVLRVLRSNCRPRRACHRVLWPSQLYHRMTGTMLLYPCRRLLILQSYFSSTKAWAADIVQLGSQTQRGHKFWGDNKLLHNIADIITTAPRRCS